MCRFKLEREGGEGGGGVTLARQAPPTGDGCREGKGFVDWFTHAALRPREPSVPDVVVFQQPAERRLHLCHQLLGSIALLTREREPLLVGGDAPARLREPLAGVLWNVSLQCPLHGLDDATTLLKVRHDLGDTPLCQLDGCVCALAGLVTLARQTPSAGDGGGLFNDGGDVIVTQLFYDNADFLRFRDACRRLGIQAPVVPGVMPVTNFAQIRRIATLCGARLPESFTRAFEAAGDDEAAQFEAGVDFAAKQVEELVAAGVPGIHFYVLNKSPATTRVLEAVGIGGRRA